MAGVLQLGMGCVDSVSDDVTAIVFDERDSADTAGEVTDDSEETGGMTAGRTGHGSTSELRGLEVEPAETLPKS
jgi:hypothetical protein